MRKVEYKDRADDNNAVHLALRAVGLEISYEMSDLVKMTMEAVQENGLNLTIRDTAKIQVEHEKKWNKYFESKSKSQK